MNQTEKNKEYLDYVKTKTRKTNIISSLFNSFWVGGLVCVIGQAIQDSLKAIFPTMAEQTAVTWSLVVLIFLAALLTGIGVFDEIGKFAGAGTIIPITGFSNSIASPAMEFKSEGIIFGLCVKMFAIAGPVIVIGVVSSILVGIVYLFV